MIAALRPSEMIAGRAPIRPACGGGLIYRHDFCGGETLVWDICGDGLLTLQCDCGHPPSELADDLGISHDRLCDIDLRSSARELAYRTLAFHPTDKAALAALALLGPGE